MFQAIDSKGNFHHLLINPLPNGEEFFCPECQQKLVLKGGGRLRRHFAHPAGQSCFYQGLNEGAEHLELKALLFEWAQKTESVQVEVGHPQAGIVTDLLLSGNLGLEIQCSPLSQEECIRRTLTYRKQGMALVWLLGSRHFIRGRLTGLQADCLQFSPACGYFFWNVDKEKRELVLHYLLHQDLHGSCQGLVRVFPFFQGSLREVLRWPYQQRCLFSFKGRLDMSFPSYLAKQLRYRNPFWMKKQVEAYQVGQNLLTLPVEAWYPQVIPVKRGWELPGITELERSYGDLFAAFYDQCQQRQKQVVYSPFYYRQDCDKIGTLEDFI
ncbi:competence protein CoiA [Streptococcus sp. 121]|uniref:competence protein CoiA n=1 Tax=Streptococcus sp. 121 TaxID=2797637 RepID=UPI0018F08121|nr:competence protein CoiA family protein [Streptococcus sp. 121]MBJ6745411.1 competence protein CoiA [Streptococcus sp. 121]